MTFSPKILTGDRPTGKLHLGHYVGSLENRVKLQGQTECILLIADLHMLTTRPSKEAISTIGDHSKGLALDYLASGIDPEQTHIYLQSAIPEIYELNLIFEMLVSVNRLSRVPSLKDMAQAAKISDDSIPFGLLGYPVLQTADILLPKATLVPIGKDNEAHLEVTREISRRFNHLYGEVFPEPEALIGDVPTLMGTDGSNKMSKSLDNCIYLSDDSNTLRKKVRSMYTDPNRIHADVPGRVEGNPVFQYLDAFSPEKNTVAELKSRYLKGQVGDGEVKDYLLECLESFLKPKREKRKDLEEDKGHVETIILEGTEYMRNLAKETMKDVRSAMGFSRNWNSLRRSAEKRMKRIAKKNESDQQTL